MGLNKRLIDQAGGAASITGTDHFAPVTYTGSGAAQSISSLDFQPDLIWIKERSNASAHAIYDSLRTNQYVLSSNTTTAQYNQGSDSGLNSFDSNGFTVDYPNTGDYYVSRSGQDYIAWCWKAGGAAVSNTDGTITSQVSANTEAGFSIATYTGTGSTSATVGHGLDSKPELVIVKGSSWASSWATHFEIGSNYYWGYLDSTARAVNSGSQVAPVSSTTFTTAHVGTNNGGQNFVGYFFHSVDGYQKIGTYTASNSWGTSVSVDVGFAPRFVMVKSVDNSGGWLMLDSSRNSGGYLDRLLAHSNAADDTTDTSCTFSGNTFNITFGSTGNQGTANVSKYIYLAIA